MSGPRCGNDPRLRLAPGDWRALAEAFAHFAQRRATLSAPVHHEPPPTEEDDDVHC